MPLRDDQRVAAVRQVEHFCAQRVPEDVRAQMRLEVSVQGAKITIIERRAPWNPELGAGWSSQPIAELRYDRGTATWSLYWPRATDRWHRYEDFDAAPEVGPLLAEIDTDPDGVFWG